ncbi:MAG: glycosyltransferase family 2 protein [Candidatus Marinimicrobia bacterium]|jgi:N-acetylglucosaminyl-diphospho-decaprenol L-rhamnosyltransferase|nr:glycosyltransferase family 2 protein [Candidatus Neomarinimicrobiota bacterium]MBT4036365.1 glycosyltransferase family 2 protein [Candidatus Neomarinimicrobiota bacterium]MBT4361254.1 glycosyltransferase family 2 protein [Candidatus Neomarinimicrobiota bacterium]MBT4716087.1 glycosyltransferase family 2 protein [Candidatus Neomarinimicrobiota bacterium]MBT4945219.1 glycosyltransferase family 2 protein [Candidatus Neomarinimicrobiota bacterium]
MLSIIIVSYNTEAILEKALRKVYAQTEYSDFEVIVVDNNSWDGSCDMVAQKFPEVHLIRHDSNSGFAAGNNIGIKQAKGEYVLLLNSDAYVFSDTLRDSVEYMEANPTVGIMGAQLVCEDGSPQPSAREFPTPWKKLKVMTGYESRHPSYATYYDYFQAPQGEKPAPRKVGWVPGTYFMIRREVVEKVGLLDEMFFMYFEEVDYCYRSTKAGWDVVFNPTVTVIHLGGQSSIASNKKISRKSKEILDIMVNSEYDYYRKNAGLRTMLMAAGVEVFWKSLIWIKNHIVPGTLAQVKANEARQSIRLIVRKMRSELIFSN